jgi:hypothetical protein
MYTTMTAPEDIGVDKFVALLNEDPGTEYQSIIQCNLPMFTRSPPVAVGGRLARALSTCGAELLRRSELIVTRP